MRMTSMNISLPLAMRRFVEEKLASGAYGNASEYIRALIRKAQGEEIGPPRSSPARRAPGSGGRPA